MNNKNEISLKKNHLPSECTPSSSTNISLDVKKDCTKLMDQSFKFGDNVLPFIVNSLPNDGILISFC